MTAEQSGTKASTESSFNTTIAVAVTTSSILTSTLLHQIALTPTYLHLHTVLGLQLDPQGWTEEEAHCEYYQCFCVFD